MHIISEHEQVFCVCLQEYPPVDDHYVKTFLAVIGALAESQVYLFLDKFACFLLLLLFLVIFFFFELMFPKISWH